MAPLVDLPAELLSRIASHLFYSDPLSHGKFVDDGFCNLRLCCRSIQIQTQYVFHRAAFSTMAVTLHAKSLSRLWDVSSHPRLGRLVKTLVFFKAYHPIFDGFVAPLELAYPQRKHEHAGYGVIELPRHGVDGVYPNEGLTLRKRVRLGLQDYLAKITALIPNLKDVVIETNFMASFWLDSPSRQEQLNEQAKRIYRMTCEIVARERQRYEEEVHGSEEAEESDSDIDINDGSNEDYDNDDHDDPYHLETYVYPDYLLYLVVRAAHNQGIQLSSLSSINPDASSIRARTFVELAPALQSLQHLKISVNASSAAKLQRMNGSTLHNHKKGQPIAQSFGQALSTLRDLRSLKLTFDGYYWEDDRNTNISKSLNHLSDKVFENLSIVDICLASFAGQTFYEFLHKQRLTLQQLTLRRITLITVDHWRPILALILENMPMLRKMRCSELTGGEGFGDTTQPLNCTEGWKGCCTVDCVEREDILFELSRALSSFPSDTL